MEALSSRDIPLFPSGVTQFERTGCCFAGHVASLSCIGSNGGDIAVYRGANGGWSLLEGAHLFGVNFVQLFPSKRVLLSGGADMVAKIWSLEEEEEEIYEAATLRGSHVSGVVAGVTIGVGRQVATGARDGGVVLWDVPTQTCSQVLSPADPTRERDLGACTSMCVVDEQVILCARDSGNVTLHDLRAPALDAGSSRFGNGVAEGALTVITLLNDDPVSVAVGSDLGYISIFDWRNRVVTKSLTRRNDASISALSSGAIVGNVLGEAWNFHDVESKVIRGPEFGESILGVIAQQLCTTSRVFLL